MLKRNRWFIVAALLYALAGGLVAVLLTLDPQLMPGEPVRIHVHLMLLGFVGQMIFGIGLHVLPRFSGHPLYSERLADAQFLLINFGLLSMVGGWLASVHVLARIGAIAAWLALACFAVNVLFTVRLKGPMD